MFLNKKILAVVCCSMALQPLAWAEPHSFHGADHPMEQEMRGELTPAKSSSENEKSDGKKSGGEKVERKKEEPKSQDKKNDSKPNYGKSSTAADKPKVKISPLLQLSREFSRRRSGNGLGLRVLGALTREMSSFGFRVHPISRKRKLHTGIDFAAPHGTKIFAADDGIIRTKKWMRGYGNTIVITHGNGVETLYAHMSRFAGVSENQVVRAGQLIGYVGNTGASTGPHLHYEIRRGGRPVNPKKNAYLVK